LRSLERTLNEYLFFEFGKGDDADEARISDTWPFALRRLDDRCGQPVFEFEDDQPYYALVQRACWFTPKAGMDLDALRRRLAGAAWIAERDPVDLATSRPGDAGVPSLLERRRTLEALGAAVFPGQPFVVREGVFLVTERRTLGLVGIAGEPDAVVVGLSQPILAPFPEASSACRLAWGVGRWLDLQSTSP
jgi:hypothetical protein